MANASAARGVGSAGKGGAKAAGAGRSEGGATLRRCGAGVALGGAKAAAVAWRSDGRVALVIRLEKMTMRDACGGD